MRYLVGFALLLALGTLRASGCVSVHCHHKSDCDDANDCTDDYCEYTPPVRLRTSRSAAHSLPTADPTRSTTARRAT